MGLTVIPEELESKIPLAWRKCCLTTCELWEAEAISLHPIPSVPVQVQMKWFSFIRKIRGLQWTPRDDNNIPLVCNLHFSASSFLPDGMKLKPNAYPTYEVSQAVEKNRLRRYRYVKERGYICKPKTPTSDPVNLRDRRRSAMETNYGSTNYLPIIPKTVLGATMPSKNLIVAPHFNIVTLPPAVVSTTLMTVPVSTAITPTVLTPSSPPTETVSSAPAGHANDCNAGLQHSSRQSSSSDVQAASIAESAGEPTRKVAAKISDDKGNPPEETHGASETQYAFSKFVEFNKNSCALCHKIVTVTGAEINECMEFIAVVKKILNLNEHKSVEETQSLCRRCISKLKPVRKALESLLEAQEEYEKERNLLLQDIVKCFCEQIRSKLGVPKRFASSPALHVVIAENWASTLTPPYITKVWDSRKLDNLVQSIGDKSRQQKREDFKDSIVKKKWAQRRNTFGLSRMVARKSKLRRKEMRTSCPICNMQLLSNSLTNHMKTHTGELKHQCVLCNKRFLRKANLNNHMKTHVVGHSSFGKSNRTYVCHKGCGQALYSGKRYVRHLMLYHPSESPSAPRTVETIRFYDCDAEGCNLSMSDLSEFQVHLKTHVSEPYSCNDCLKIFADRRNMDQHKSFHEKTDNSCSCEYCHEAVANEDKEHHDFFHKITVDSNMIKFRCQQCGKIFLSDWDLIQHVGLHRTSGSTRLGGLKKKYRMLMCEICGATFNAESRLQMHSYIHTNPQGFNCNTCGTSFPNPNKLWIHQSKNMCNPAGNTDTQQAAQPAPGLKPGSSVFKKRKRSQLLPAQKTRRNTTIIKSHRQKTGVKQTKQLNCQHCEYTSKGSLYLFRRHLLIHHPEMYVNGKEHFCRVCWKNFATYDELVLHQNTIHDRYKCKICGKVMGNIIRLQEHQRVHTGEKPYSCNYCDKLFSFEANLKEHEYRHTGHRPHVCQVCSKGFFRKKLLNSHAVKNHT